MIEALRLRLVSLDPALKLKAFREAKQGRIVFTTSFGLEDQVITSWIASQKLDIDIITLDTGRLFQETYDLWNETQDRYGVRIASAVPERAALESYTAAHGPNGFYKGLAERKACCELRKVLPLKGLLNGAAGWITGMRADQSQVRADISLLAVDPVFHVSKLNPLIDWNREQVLSYAKTHDVPMNALHARGFASIGCAPCTRAIEEGELERDGRWWWETKEAAGKECGLHVGADGKLTRTTQQAGALS